METEGVEEEKANYPATDDAPTKIAPSAGFELPKFHFSMSKSSQPMSKSVTGEASVQKSAVDNEDGTAQTDGANVLTGGNPQKVDGSEVSPEGHQKNKLDAGQSFQCAIDRSVVSFREPPAHIERSFSRSHTPTLHPPIAFSLARFFSLSRSRLSSPSSMPAHPQPCPLTHLHALLCSPASRSHLMVCN